MPKIRIKEKDLTTNPVLNGIPNAFFVVYGTESIPTRIVNKIEASTPTDTENFINEALRLGGVIYAASAYSVASDYLKDRNQFDIKFLLAEESEITTAIDIAAARKDCAVVLGLSSTSYASGTLSALTSELSYITQKGANGFYADEVKTAAGKYVLPYCGINLSGITTKPEQAYGLAYLNATAKGNPEWHAVAGYKRGLIPGATDAGFLKESEIDAMQSRLNDMKCAINPICYVNPWGVRIWGNRTALPNTNVGSSEADQLVASSFANVRVLICDIKKALYNAAKQYQFEQNNDILWVNFTSEVNGLLEKMKQSYGIAGYRWIRQDSNERAKLKAILRIIPIEAVEDFDLTLELADSLEVGE